MKKIALIISIMLMPLLGCAAQSGKDTKDKIISLISEYKYCDGFDVVSTGSVGTMILKKVAELAIREDREDYRQFHNMVKGIKKLMIISYDECEPRVRERFTAKMDRALSHSEMLMEFKDKEDVMRVYAVVDDKAEVVKDFVMYNPEDCTLICLFGSIPTSVITSLAD